MAAIKLTQLDTTILNAVKNFSGAKLTGIKGPIINGIVMSEASLKGTPALAVAKEITKSVTVGEGTVLKPTTQPFGDGKILVGFQIRSE